MFSTFVHGTAFLYNFIYKTSHVSVTQKLLILRKRIQFFTICCNQRAVKTFWT